jgi:HAMP domain-containing protein
VTLGNTLALVISAASVIFAIIALVRSSKTERAQRKIALLLRRLEAYDSAVAIGRQIDQASRIRLVAKVSSEEVIELDAEMRSEFTALYEIYGNELQHQVKLLDELHEQSYFPDELSQAIRHLGRAVSAATLSGDVSVDAVRRQTDDIEKALKRLRDVHARFTSAD